MDFATRVKGTLTINFSANIAHLMDGGEQAYVELMANDPDGHDEDVPEEERERWWREAYRKQRFVQLAQLQDAELLKPLLRRMVLSQVHADIDVDSLPEAIKEAAEVSGTTNFFMPDMFNADWELSERAHLLEDSVSLDLGAMSVKLTKIQRPDDGHQATPMPPADLFSSPNELRS